MALLAVLTYWSQSGGNNRYPCTWSFLFKENDVTDMSSGMLEDETDSNDESSEITIVKVRPRDWLIQPEPDETHERNNNNAISTYEV